MASSSKGSDAHFAEDDEDEECPLYCCMHVTEAKSKVVKFSEKSFAKFRACSNRWRELNCPESAIAAAVPPEIYADPQRVQPTVQLTSCTVQQEAEHGQDGVHEVPVASTSTASTTTAPRRLGRVRERWDS